MEQYSFKEQELINTTLKVAQDQGWNPNSDPFQFYIIVGGKLEKQENVIKSLYKEIKKLENDIKNKKEEIDDVEENLQLKEQSIEELENDLSKVVSELSYQKENNHLSLAIQVGENVKLEKKIGIQSNVIHEMKENLKAKENLAIVEKTKEVDELVDDLKNLRIEIEMKETMLKKSSDENEKLQSKLQVLEEEQKAMMTSKEFFYENKVDKIDIIEVGNFSNAKKNTETYKCDICGKDFGDISDLKYHIKNKHEESDARKIWNVKLKHLESGVYQQKLELTFKLFKSKEKELKEKQNFKCRGICKIYHQKHNWKRSRAEESILKLQKLTEMSPTGFLNKSSCCDVCEETFWKQEELKNHMSTNHLTHAYLISES